MAAYMRSFSSEMESPPESVDYFAAGTTEKDQGSKVGQVADEHESLAQHLKRLFLYCSLFPSGYEFSKDELIQLWIAEGFIRERQNQRMEDTASEHFNSLQKGGFFVLSRSDFTSVLSAPTDNLGNFLYKVNPIKHSILGDTISSGNYFRAVDGKLDGASEMTRHLSLICEDIDGMTFGILQNFKHLRTLHLLSCRGSSIKHVPRDLCFSLTFLRTLNLSGTLISELPSSIGNIKSLRYIDASHTPISRLPESIDSLHKLQTIKLRGCKHFVQLPKGMRKLSNLRHIDLDIIRQLDSMPAYIGNLSNLQTLPAFLVGRDDGCHVGELKNLNDLKGVFNISRLENVLSKEEAEEAALSDKKFIHSLELRWSNLFVEYAEQQEKVLECLQPHFGLKGLQIQQYSGSILPTWISNPAFADLVAITLYRCRNCKLLPCMGQLPALKSLSIIEVNEVKKINHQFFRNGPVDPAFPKLERLEVDIMLNLKEWMDVQMGDLPSLVKLTVDSCPELVTIPPLSCLKSLKHLEFRRCPKLLSLPIDGLPTSLECFLILDCLELNEWCLSGEHWRMLCHVPSVWFDNEEGPRGITYQSTSTSIGLVEEKLTRWEADQTMIFDSTDEATEYLMNTVEETRQLIESLKSLCVDKDYKNYELLHRADDVLQKSMARLEYEFRYMLVQNRQPCAPEHMSSRSSEEDTFDENSLMSFGFDSVEDSLQSSFTIFSEDSSIDLIRPEVIPDLRRIANMMFNCKYDQECTQAYITLRRDALDECLSYLEIQKLSMQEVRKMEWVSLNSKISRWIWVMKIFVRIYLSGEKWLSEQIFEELGPVRLDCFVEVSKASILQLLKFAEAMSIGPHQPERLVRILDIYKVLGDLLLDIDALYFGEAGSSVSRECHDVLLRLGDSVKATVFEFENAIASNPSTYPVSGGGIHPLTRYVMNYMRTLTDYGQTLNLLLKDCDEGDPISLSPDMSPTAEEENNSTDSSGRKSPMARQFLSFASSLESNLDEKSKLYKDASLQHVFLMNNIHYMVQKVKGAELRLIFEDDWIRKHNRKFQQHAMSYQRASWSYILSLLKEEGIQNPGSNSVSKTLLKERLRSFYLAFEEIYKVQTAWLISDPQLREDLQISTSLNVIEAYRTFVGRHSNDISDKLIRYSANDMENYLMDLFEGSPKLLQNSSRR